MTDANVETVAPAKAERVVEKVKMEDGREVEFAGKRKVLKETLIDESKIVSDGTTVQVEAGAVSVRFDVRNGATRTFALPVALLVKFAGHGAEQKYGDELAAPANNPLSEDDIVLALEALDARIQKGEWRVAKEGGGGVSGASIVIQAIVEATGKDVATVKAFLQKKLDADSTLTRQQLYASFRSPTSKTGVIIRRLEEEKAAKATKVNSDELLGEI
jgi:hypothetical protein